MNSRKWLRPLFLFLQLALIVLATSAVSAVAQPPAAGPTPRSGEPLSRYTLTIAAECSDDDLFADIQGFLDAGQIAPQIIRKEAELLVHARRSVAAELALRPCIATIMPGWQPLARMTASAPAAALPKTGMQPASVADAVLDLQEDTGSMAQISLDKTTGTARFVRFPQGLDLQPARAQDMPPEALSAAFFDRYGAAFGMRDPGTELALAASEVDRFSNTHLAYRQLYKGYPVYAAELKVHFDRANRVTAVNGIFVPGISIASTAPTVSAAEAGEAAIDLVAAQNGLDETAAPLTVRGSRLLVYRTNLLRGLEGRDHLVYELEIASAPLTIREFIYVDAHSGTVIDQVTGVNLELKRKVSKEYYGNVVWSEGDPDPIPVGWAGAAAQQVSDWQDIINGARETYNLFATMSGGSYLSFDGSSAVMYAISKQDDDMFCPNAAWYGSFAEFCKGVTGDDIVAHEFAHAYTQYTSSLVYRFQSGALNEAYSDIWGEVVDLLNDRGLDDPDVPRPANSCSAHEHGGSLLPGAPEVDTVRWLVGEDSRAFFRYTGRGNAIRDMANPACFGDPGKVTDEAYYCEWADSGGVHTNSGVPDHAFALLVDGGTYNGADISALGLTKAAHIYWSAQNMLTLGSNFGDQADALQAACGSLAGVDLPALSTSVLKTDSSGEIITPADCREVAKVNSAVELRAAPCTNPGHGAVSGTVTAAADGAPIRDILAVALSKGSDNWYWDWEGEDFTDSSGLFVVQRLQPDDFWVVFLDPHDRYGQEYYDDAASLAGASLITVESGRTTDNVDASLALAGRISGTVTAEADGSPLRWITVSVVRYDRENGSYEIVQDELYTDEYGQYITRGFGPGEYQIQFFDDENHYVSELYDDVPVLGEQEPTFLQVEPGKTIAGVDAALTLAGHLAGTVTSEADGSPLPNIKMQVLTFSSYHNRWVLDNNHWTDDEGKFDAPVNWALSTDGPFRLKFSDGNGVYQEEYYDDVPDLASATDLRVNKGQRLSGIHVALAEQVPPGNDNIENAFMIWGPSYERTQAVQAATTAPDDPALPCAEAGQGYHTMWFKYHNHGSDAYVNIDTFGADFDTVLAVWKVKDGSLKMVACSDDAATPQSEIKNLALKRSKDYFIEVAAKNEHAAGNLILAVAESFSLIGGTIRDELTALPIAGVDVDIYRYNDAYEFWQWIDYQITDGSGQYVFESLVPGQYRLAFQDFSGGYAREYHADAADFVSASAVEVAAGQEYVIDAALEPLSPPDEPEPDRHEPNDSMAAATPLKQGTIEAAIDAHDDVAYYDDKDFYSFTGAEQETITVDVNGRGNLSPSMQLLDKDGRIIEELIAWPGFTLHLQATLPAAGKYYLLLQGDCHEGGGGCDGPYELTFSSQKKTWTLYIPVAGR